MDGTTGRWRVLITGGFGNLGSHAVRQCLQDGALVRVLDRPTRGARRAAEEYAGRVETIWGDVTETDPDDLVRDQDAVIHTAFVLWPTTERNPSRAAEVNVGGTQRLLTACEQAVSSPRFVFASSIGVYGHTQALDPPRLAGDPLSPVDVYTRTKVEAESIVQGAAVPWVILRLAVAPPIQSSGFNRDQAEQLRLFFRTRPDNRVEFVHPADVGIALSTACRAPEAPGRILLIGGGAKNRLRSLDLANGVMQAAGIGRFPAGVFGQDELYTDWVDSAEAEQILRFQRRSFEDYIADARAAMGIKPHFIRPVAPLIRFLMIKRFSPQGTCPA